MTKSAAMNRNHVLTDEWSNEASGKIYRDHWPHEPMLAEQHERGEQCGGCSFYATLNSDWGLCCHKAARHHLETVFEHFTCPAFLSEGWGAHSFTLHTELHCRCDGGPLS